MEDTEVALVQLKMAIIAEAMITMALVLLVVVQLLPLLAVQQPADVQMPVF